MLGNGWASAVHQEDRSRVQEEWKSAVQQWRPFEETYKTRGGIKVQARANPSRWIRLHWRAAEVGELTAGVVISELEREKCRAQVAIHAGWGPGRQDRAFRDARQAPEKVNAPVFSCAVVSCSIISTSHAETFLSKTPLLLPERHQVQVERSASSIGDSLRFFVLCQHAEVNRT